MAKKRDKNMEMALRFRDHLLWELMGDNMGTKPEHPVPANTATFAEKKGLLSEMVKLAELSRKSSSEDETESGLDLIKRSLKDGSGTGRGRGNSRRAKSSADEPGEDGSGDESEES